jgi:hypothetical protein
MKYNIGDKVRIVEEFPPDSHDVPTMRQYLGKTVTITKADDSYNPPRYWIDADGGAFFWVEHTIAGYAYEITLEDFIASDKVVAIHCKTPEEAEILCESLHRSGCVWSNGETYHNNYTWADYKERTCYSNNGTYGTLNGFSGCKVFEFDEVQITNKPLPKDAMQIFMRDKGMWQRAKFDSKRGRILNLFDREIYETDIIAIKNDERAQYVKCKACGAIIKNTPEDIAAHLAKKLDCVNCTHVRCDTIAEDGISFEALPDGTYIRNEKTKCKLFCGRNWNTTYVGDPKLEYICLYRNCSNESLKSLSGFFSEYPDAFDVIATVDALGDKWTHVGGSGNGQYYYEFGGKMRLTAYINTMCMITKFAYQYYDSCYEFTYSAKYNKIVWFDGREYSMKPSTHITTKNYTAIEKIMKEIYEEKKK